VLKAQKRPLEKKKRVNQKENMDQKNENQKPTEDKVDNEKTGIMKTILNFIKETFMWLKGVFNDEKGNPSSKRIVGMGCAVALCITMYHNSFSSVDVAPARYLVDAVALLAFGTLGLASVDKLTARRGKKKEEDSEE